MDKWDVRRNGDRFEVYYLKPDGVRNGGVWFLAVIYDDYDTEERARAQAD